MENNVFDKENISKVDSYELPSSYLLFGDDGTTYDISKNRAKWWRCPKCGGSISFDSMDEEFDEDIGEGQFVTVYGWDCTECGAHGTTFAVVNPLYITIEQDGDADEKNED